MQNKKTEYQKIRQRLALNFVATLGFIVAAGIWIPQNTLVGSAMVFAACCYGFLASRDYRIIGESEAKFDAEIFMGSQPLFSKNKSKD